MNQKMVLAMLFFNFENTNLKFIDKKFNQSTNIIEKTFLTTQKIEIIKKEKFANNALHRNINIFVIYIDLFIFIKFYQS